MYVKIPAQIVLYGILDNLNHIRTNQTHMMFEAIVTDVLH